MKYFIYIAFFALFFLSACQPTIPSTTTGDQDPLTTSQSNGDEDMNTQGFLDALVSAGATVDQQGEVAQPFFSVPGQVISVNGKTVQVFEYPDASQAEAEAAQVAPDGSSIGTTMASWVGPPHFFRGKRLIVLYVGEDQAVIELIETVLGPQFAGSEPVKPPSLDIEPPASTLQIGGGEQVSGIGSYCWNDPAAGVAFCKDKVGIPTSPDPIVVKGSFVARFINPLPITPGILTLATIPVVAEDKMSTEIDGMHWWQPNPGDQYDFPLASPHEIKLSLEPGLYVLDVFAQWQEYGDVSYGFLVDVAPAQD